MAAVYFVGVGTLTATPVPGPAVVFAGVGTFTPAPAGASIQVAFAGVGTFTIVAPGVPTVAFAGVGTFAAKPVGNQYQLFVADQYGSKFGEVANARIASFSYELNGVGAAAFTLATTDPAARFVHPGREIQIYRNGILIWAGPIVRPQAGLRETTWQCAGLAWYFGRRFMGRADRTNLLTNGDFEAGEANWAFQNGVSHSLDTGLKVEGTQSLKLAGATANHSQYATQTMPAWQQSHPYGDALTTSVWVYIPSVGYLGGAVQDLGLVAIHRDSAGATKNAAYAEIGDETEKDAWIPLEVLLPAVKQDDTIEVRLFPPHGTAYFDLVTLTAMESLSFWPGRDVGVIIEGIVNYAQGRPTISGTFAHGKSDLNINVATVTTGTVVNYSYQFAEHRNIFDAILEFVRQGVVDIDIDPATRTFTVYTPSKGSLFGTTLELNTNLADFTWSWDGENAATSVVVLGPGDGPDRPEGGASDTTALGGLTLEIVESAPDNVTVGQLDARATERLGVVSNPEIVEVTTLPDVGVIGNIAVGDTVPVNIDHGWVVINATYRVKEITINPQTDQATLALNVA